ncbi:hypothetical protein AB0L40_05220 [Patulibacter sp. NPDC049589]|uniref:NADH-quinone oxidoreductase subunit D-related protein n=1 Tax=Patulibacter sp. NPDC049589 TaxID=3154731 RepID=UPI003415AB36
MVVTAPALVLPDEQSWALWGPDPAELGLRADHGPPERLRDALVPESSLGAAADALLGRLPDETAVQRSAAPTGTVSVDDPEPDDCSEGGDDGDHDMMAIVGNPSADGLIMEDLKVVHGPFGTALPGGLQLSVTLDGDVVRNATVMALLRVAADTGAPTAPDLLAPAAWRATLNRALDRPTDLRAVEHERALSHVAWLRALGRLLNDQRLATAAGHTVVALRRDSPTAQEQVAHLGSLLKRRTIRRRLEGRARLDADTVAARGLRGPIARAAGIPDDARGTDPAYVAMGFSPLTAAGGDAWARAGLRVAEALAAVDLCRRLADRSASTCHAVAAPAVEGPRGPLSAQRIGDRWRLSAAGADAARRAAADLMIGCEWSSALMAAVSLDLSPWNIDAHE